MKIAPLRFLLKITSLGIDDGFYYEGFDEHYDGADIDLPEFFPVKRAVSLRGEDIVSTRAWKVVNITWFLNKHNGGLVEIVDPSAIDLTEEAAEATRLRLAAERKEILRVQRLKS